jgi:response regulator RpfG family c-di-GMP phosphodiesterase
VHLQEQVKKGESMCRTHQRSITAPLAGTGYDTEPVTVLCIDDDPNVATAIQLWLKQYEIDLLVAEYGTQGVDLATRHRPSAIITDVGMPQGDGEHIVACLKQLPETCEIPIIVLTGSKDRLLQLRMTQLGIHEFFNKPVSWKLLEESLFKAIGQANTGRSQSTLQPHAI